MSACSSGFAAGGGIGGAGAGGPWRLLSGQSNGQLLLWELEGTRPRLVSALGAPTGSAVRAVCLFPSQGIMVAAHADGVLRVFPLPSPSNGAAGGDGAGAAGCDPSCPRVLGDVPRWAPRVAAVRAHKGALVSATSLVRFVALSLVLGGWGKEGVLCDVCMLRPAIYQ